MSDGFKNKGHNVFTVDIDEKFNVDWYADVSKISTQDIIEKFGVPDVLWAGTPCESYSVAAISKHRKKNPQNGSLDPTSDHAKFCDEMNKHLLKIIDELLEINPNMIWFIENPVGALRKMDFMQNLPRYTITYCTYMRQEPWETRRMKKQIFGLTIQIQNLKSLVKMVANIIHLVQEVLTNMEVKLLKVQ